MSSHSDRGTSADVDIARAQHDAALKEAQLHGIQARNRAIELAAEVARLTVLLDRSQAQGMIVGAMASTIDRLKLRTAALETVLRAHDIPVPPPFEEKDDG